MTCVVVALSECVQKSEINILAGVIRTADQVKKLLMVFGRNFFETCIDNLFCLSRVIPFCSHRRVSHDVVKEWRIGLISRDARNSFRWSRGVSQGLSSSEKKDVDGVCEG